jgi:Na+-transporting NADH:ubiquinone oxidoreductase subunit NqrF
LSEDQWGGATGFIHEVVLDHYLKSHQNPQAIEFYVCGPPMMIKACAKMLEALNVPGSQIAYDEF